MSKRITILGAGPTGLSCGWYLSKNGYSVTIIEKENFIGGTSTTFQHKDMALDLGPHRFTPHTEEILKFVKNLCGNDLKLMPQHIKVYLKKKYFDYPFKALELAFGMSPFAPIKFVSSFLANSFKKKLKNKPEISYKDWVENRFGNALYNLTFGPIAKKTWGLDPSNISATIARQRISMPGLAHVAIDLLRGMVGLKKKYAITNPLFPEGYFFYPENGIGQISEAMASEIKSNGGKILLNSKPDKILCSEETITGILIADKSRPFQRDIRPRCKNFSTSSSPQQATKSSEKGRDKYIETDFLLSTIPISQLISIIAPSAPFQIVQASSKLKFRSLVLFFLVVKKNKIGDNIAIFFPESKYPFGRVSEQKNFSAKMIPKGKTVICAEITADEKDDIWNKDDKWIFNKIVPQLEECSLLKANEITDYFSHKIYQTYPVCDLDFEDNLNTVLQYFKSIENLITNGRGGLFKYNNLHHSLEMGLLAAKHIASGKKKEEMWEKCTELFESYCMVE